MMHTTTPLRMHPEAYPIALPHVSWAPHAFFFGHRPVRDAQIDHWELLLLCDGTRTLGEVMRTHDASAREAALIAPWVLWWPAPLAGSPRPAPGCARLIFGPHPEDAWLGMGGRLLLEAAERPTHIITCFGLLANALDPIAFRTANEISAITRDELALAARLAGVTHEHWELPARELRPHATGVASSTEWIKSLLREVVVEAVDRMQPAEVFVPFAADPYSDAGILLEVMLALFIDGLLGDADLHVYETMDAAGGYRAVDEFLARFEQSYIVLPDYFVSITDSHVRKRALLELFRTRVDHRDCAVWLEAAARNAFVARLAPHEHAEHYWRIGLAGFA